MIELELGLRLFIRLAPTPRSTTMRPPHSPQSGFQPGDDRRWLYRQVLYRTVHPAFVFTTYGYPSWWGGGKKREGGGTSLPRDTVPSLEQLDTPAARRQSYTLFSPPPPLLALQGAPVSSLLLPVPLVRATPSFALRLRHLRPLRRWRSTYYQSCCIPSCGSGFKITQSKKEKTPFLFCQERANAERLDPPHVRVHYNTTRTNYYKQNHPTPRESSLVSFWRSSCYVFVVLRVLASADLISHFVPSWGSRGSAEPRFGRFALRYMQAAVLYCVLL